MSTLEAAFGLLAICGGPRWLEDYHTIWTNASWEKRLFKSVHKHSEERGNPGRVSLKLHFIANEISVIKNSVKTVEFEKFKMDVGT